MDEPGAPNSIKRIMHSMSFNNKSERPTVTPKRSPMTGWLRKQGGVVKSWHRRWFVLEGDMMTYYNNPTDYKKLGEFLLPGNVVTEHPHNPQEPDKFLFEIRPGPDKSRITTTHESYLLCAATEAERRTWIQVIKRIMYADRGGAIFGQHLQETMAFESRNSQRMVPEIVEMCIEFLMQYGLEVEGLFRLPGRTSHVKELRDRFDMGERPQFSCSSMDVHSVASLLKLYLRELPEPLIPICLYEEVIQLTCREMQINPDKAFEGLRDLLSRLSCANYNLLKYLCGFLKAVSRQEVDNRMSPMNLATIFMHNFLQPEGEDPTLLMATASPRTQTTFLLISHCELLFRLDYTPEGAILQVDNLLDLGPLTLRQEAEVPRTPDTAGEHLLDLDFGDTQPVLDEPLLMPGEVIAPPLQPSVSCDEPFLSVEETSSAATANIASPIPVPAARHGSIGQRTPPPRPPSPLRRRTSSDPPLVPTRPAPVPGQNLENGPLSSSKSTEGLLEASGLFPVPSRRAPPPPAAVKNAPSMDSISTISYKSLDIDIDVDPDQNLLNTDVVNMTTEQLHIHIASLGSSLVAKQNELQEATANIRLLKAEHQVQLADMARKLDEAEQATASAVERVIELQCQSLAEL